MASLKRYRCLSIRVEHGDAYGARHGLKAAVRLICSPLMTRFAIQRVRATPEALELIERLVERHGPIAFFPSGGLSDGSTAMCLTRAELLPTDNDLKLGEIGGAPFYIDVEQYERLERPALLIDVAPGAAGGFPLEGLEDVHFVMRTANSAAVGG